MSLLEEQLADQIPTCYEREYRFASEHVGGGGKGLRQRLRSARLSDWRFDFAYPDLMLAIEVEGGGWSGGRHTRGSGFAKDMQKYAAAFRLGWTVYRCDAALIKSGQAAEDIKNWIDQHKETT